MQNSVGFRTIDLELAQLSKPDPVARIPYNSDAPDLSVDEVEPNTHVLERTTSLTSSLGRREGWLSGSNQAPRHDEATQRGPVDISAELARITGNRRHSGIWDGDGSDAGSETASIPSNDEEAFRDDHPRVEYMLP